MDMPHPAVQFMIVVAILIIIVYAIFRKVPISLRGGPVSLDVSLATKLETMSTQLEEIGVAVNHSPQGEPTLVERVRNVESTVDALQALSHWQADATVSLASHVGLAIPDPPDRRQSGAKK